MNRQLLAALLATSLACGARTSLEPLPLDDAQGRGGNTASGGKGSTTDRGGSTTLDAGVGVGGAVSTPLCGNGFSDPGEECDFAARNADNLALVLRQGNFSQPITPLLNDGDVVLFYAYSSESSHTGYEEAFKSRLLLYRTPGDATLSLVMFHGIDFEATGIRQPPDSFVVFRITTSGDALGTASVTLSDEPREVQQLSEGEFVADWTFNSNSDGCIIGGLPLPGNWSVVVAPSFVSNIDTWDFIDGSGSYVGLDPTVPVQIEASANPSACRLDCTLPRCGDGILDAGEACDDGNLVDGDGCSACQP